MALACCSAKHLAPAAESQGSGRLLRPYRLEPLTYLGGAAQEEAGKKTGRSGRRASTAASGVFTKVQGVSLTDTPLHAQKMSGRTQGTVSSSYPISSAGTKNNGLGNRDFSLSTLFKIFPAYFTFVYVKKD